MTFYLGSRDDSFIGSHASFSMCAALRFLLDFLVKEENCYVYVLSLQGAASEILQTKTKWLLVYIWEKSIEWNWKVKSKIRESH